MSAPTFGSIGTFLSGTAATAQFAVPAGVASGDVIVIVFYVDSSTTVTALPSGFAHAAGSPLYNVPPGVENSLNIIAKRATAADTGTYDVTLSASAYRNGAAIRYTGCVASGTFWDANSGIGTAVAIDTSSSGTVTPAVSMTTLAADEMLVFAATNWTGGAWTPPTGFTERIDFGDRVLTADDKVQAVAGATGSVTATCAGAQKRTAWLGALIGITSGTSYNQSVAGALTPAAAVVRSTTKLPSGTLAPAGALTRLTAKALAGALTPSGSIRRAVAKTLTGTLGAAGTIAKQTAKRLLGALTPTGSVTASTVPPAPLRDLQLTVGPPEARWTAGQPAARWDAGVPGLKWTNGTPEV